MKEALAQVGEQKYGVADCPYGSVPAYLAESKAFNADGTVFFV